jgi:hypothetical protein
VNVLMELGDDQGLGLPHLAPRRIQGCGFFTRGAFLPRARRAGEGPERALLGARRGVSHLHAAVLREGAEELVEGTVGLLDRDAQAVARGAADDPAPHQAHLHRGEDEAEDQAITGRRGECDLASAQKAAGGRDVAQLGEHRTIHSVDVNAHGEADHVAGATAPIGSVSVEVGLAGKWGSHDVSDRSAYRGNRLSGPVEACGAPVRPGPTVGGR